jgi:hypothetical protein
MGGIVLQPTVPLLSNLLLNSRDDLTVVLPVAIAAALPFVSALSQLGALLLTASTAFVLH